MPGSKTYTSTKSNELFEAEIELYLKKQNSSSAVEKCINVIIEVAKIILSAIIPIYIDQGFAKLFSASNTVSQNQTSIPNPNSVLTPQFVAELFVPLIFYFSIGYAVLTILFSILKYLVQCFLSGRFWPKSKEAAKVYYHKVTLNQILLAMSFENKLRFYTQELVRQLSEAKPEEVVEKTIGDETKKHSVTQECETYVDMICSYFSEALYNIDNAIIGLKEAIPPSIGNKVKRAVNLDYCQFIGIEYLKTGTNALKNILSRLTKSHNDLEDFHKKNTIVISNIDDLNVIIDQGAKIRNLLQVLENIVKDLQQYSKT